MKRNSARHIVVAIGVVAPLLILAGRLAWHSVTPDPLPTHWSGSTVNGTTGATALFVWMLVISVGLAIGAAVVVHQPRSPGAGRPLVAILVGGAWQVASVYLLSVILSRHAADALSVRLPWGALMLSVLVPVGVGVLVWFLLPATTTAPQRLPQSTLSLGAAERVAWLSRARSRPLQLLAGAMTVAAAALVFVAVTPAVIVFVVAVALAGTSEVAVRVDQDGLHTLWGPVGWPRQIIRLDDIAEAHAETIHPLQWGGWGYRLTSRGTAANVRTGPGIVVQRTSGSSYAVTVDDAAEGADVLNALLVRGSTRS